MKSILKQLGYFLFELGVGLLTRDAFKSEVRANLDKLVEELSDASELTSRQKHNRAKKLLDDANKDVPDFVKNVIIEASVGKLTKHKRKLIVG